jgi:4-amino-4-deoxy-L-arabinose transferase-like glycosyltransferase
VTKKIGPALPRWLLPVLLLLIFWVVSIRYLALVPPVADDEPWQASTGWKIAATGVFGTDVFAGWFGMDRHYYGYMPLHPMLLALVYKLAGLGLWQTRFEPVVMGLVTLALTYALGRRLAGPNVGTLAVTLLLITRTAAVTRYALTGILMLDTARIARYDMVVPVFGLASLHAYISAVRAAAPRKTWYFGLAGGLAALAGLSHLYGAFWLPVLLALAIWQGAGWRNVAALLACFAVPWLLYGLYVLSGFSDWQGQFSGYGNRFELTSLAWYWNNLVLEPKRYGAGLGMIGWYYLARPGLWASLIAVPAAIVYQAVRALRDKQALSQTVLVPVVMLPLLYGLLLTLKLANYLVMIIPLFSVVVAWGAIRLWHWAAGQRRPPHQWLRLAMATAFVAVSAEGASRVWALERAAQTTTPYTAITSQIRQSMQAGDRLLALHVYWLGLTDVDFISWLVPVLLAGPHAGSAGMGIEPALDQVAPDVVVLDSSMLRYFRSTLAPDPSLTQILAWLGRNGFIRLAVLDDETYGHLEIYRRPRAP